MEDILLKRLSTFIQEIKILSESALSLCKVINDDNLESARVVSAKLKALLSRFTAELHNYFNMCNNPDADQISSFTTTQIEADVVLAELEEKVKSKTANPVVPIREPELSSYSKMPELNMPVFDGNILDWHQFWDQFTSNLNRRKLNDVDKLLYLKGSLKGDAARLIDGLSTTNRNYQIAVDTLKARYGKEHEILYAHHKAMNNVKKAATVEDCREVLDELERHLRVLESLGENINSNHVKFLIMEKFPTDIIYEVKMRMSSTSLDSVEDLRKQLSTIISTKDEARRMMTQEASTSAASQYTTETLHTKAKTLGEKRNSWKPNNPHDKKQNRNQWNNSKPKHSNWNSRQGNGPMKRRFEPKKEGNGKPYGGKKRKWSCIFCEGDHNNIDCEKVKTVDERKKKLNGRCFICLRIGHRARTCLSKKDCEYCGKKPLHHKTLCPNRSQRKEEKKESTNAMHINRKGSTVLQTAIVKVKKHGNITKACRILLDCGSQRSYVTRQLAKELNLQVEEHNNLAIFTFGSQAPKELESPLVKLELMTRENTVLTLFANVVPSISQGVPYPEKELADWNTKERYILADDGTLSDRVDILLGNDYYYSVMSTKKIHIKQNLYLVESEFGWILSGNTCGKPVEHMSVLTYFQSSCDVGLNPPDLPLGSENLTYLWDLESIGITDSPKVNRDEEAIKHFNETTEYKNNRYYVSWPWNEYPPNLPSNFGLAFGRLVNLVKRLNSDTLMKYDLTLKEQLEAEIIEIVPFEKEEAHPTHYIPHHGVSAPGKSLRIVYDASAKTKDNKSLNECLYCGPLMLEDLTGLIIKFRSYSIGLTADVEKAFLQIGLNKQDRDVTRFLWVKDINKPIDKDNLVHLRFTRVPFGIISSPFMLNATVKHHLLKAEKEDVRQLANDIYVDNVVTGTRTIKEAVDLYENSKETFNLISMNLRAWSSNSKDFMNKISDTCPDKVVRILGLDWHLEEDTLQLRIKVVNSANTKRGILKSVASIYDPCGYAVPALLAAKLLLQDLWKMKMKWDTPLSKDFVDKWNDIQKDLDEVKEISLDRYYMNNNPSDDCQIHCFTDASTKAYSAVVYVVGTTTKSFVIGKSRLVPIKDQENLKIPRLELLGVLIGSRLINYTRKFVNLNITQQVLWTDSQIVIDWFNSSKLLTPFVSRRIEEIRRNKDLIIRYVPSELNPADVATRPTNSKEDRKIWLDGPDFLLQDPSSWPVNSFRAQTLLVGEDLTKTDEIRKESNESKISEIQKEPSNPKEVDVNHVQEMETDVLDNTLKEVKKIQEEHFREEVNGKVTCLSRNLGLFTDIDGILRCRGRFKNASWSFDKRYPILIPKHCEFTDRIIKSTHENNYHVGVNHTLSLIRESYWIPQGKSKVQQILSKCSRCVKHGGGPFKLPVTPALPTERVNFTKPFTFSGVDYLGPVSVKTENGTSKRWLCLFTCLAVRAVHLEVVKDLTAEEGLLALRRMVSTRGLPSLITSDNALHFKLIADIVSKPYCTENKIRWRFIPELAPWFGGFYERLVGMVKHCMRRTLQKHLLGDSQLATVTKEIEAILNTRPLTCVDSELEHILTPADFLNLGQCITMETAQEDALVQGTATKLDLVNNWKRGRVILDEFKEMFRNRYLPSLRERYNHSHKQPRVMSREIPKEGQIVQIKGDNKNREGWRVGKVISLLKGSDGLARVAKVKVGDTLFTRSIAHLYPLEIEDNEQLDLVLQDTRENVETQKLPVNTPETSRVIQDNVIEETDDAQKETLADSEIEEVDDIDMTDNTVGETNKEVQAESTDRVDNDITRDVNETDEVSMTKENETADEQPLETRHKRIAAVRALEKIREWTRNLMSILH